MTGEARQICTATLRSRRCGGCGEAVGSYYTACPKCDCDDLLPGEPCRNPAMRGSSVCYKHGGRAPQVQAKAAERQITAEVQAELARLGEAQPVTNPLGRLLSLAGEVDARLGVFRSMMAGLDSLAAVDSFGVDRAKALVTLYIDASKELAAILTSVSRLGIEDRLARMQEIQADHVLTVLETLFAAVFAPQSVAAAKGWFAEAVTAIEGGTVPAPPPPRLEALTVPSAPVLTVQSPSASVSSPERAGVEGHNVIVEPSRPVQAVTEPVGPDPDTAGDDSEAVRPAERPPVTSPRHGARIVKVSSTVGAGHPDDGPRVVNPRNPNQGPPPPDGSALTYDLWRQPGGNSR